MTRRYFVKSSDDPYGWSVYEALPDGRMYTAFSQLTEEQAFSVCDSLNDYMGFDWSERHTDWWKRANEIREEQRLKQQQKTALDAINRFRSELIEWSDEARIIGEVHDPNFGDFYIYVRRNNSNRVVTGVINPHSYDNLENVIERAKKTEW